MVETLGGSRGDPLATVAALNHVLFDENACGERQDTRPRNSFINEVMDRRLGIPISLSLLYLEVARRADLPVVGWAYRDISSWPCAPRAERFRGSIPWGPC